MSRTSFRPGIFILLLPILAMVPGGCGKLGASTALKSLVTPPNKFKIDQTDYKGVAFEIGYRPDIATGLHKARVSRVEPPLTAANEDGLQAKNAARQMFEQNGICKKGQKAYAVPGNIKFNGDGTWSILIRCTG